jgi:hypothetical protein
MPTDNVLREALVRALVVEPDRQLAGAVLDRWDELTTGMPMSELLSTILTPNVTQAKVIPLYAAEIRRQSPALMHGPVWKVINDAIVSRWSERGLVRIKKEAWRLIDAEE